MSVSYVKVYMENGSYYAISEKHIDELPGLVEEANRSAGKKFHCFLDFTRETYVWVRLDLIEGFFLNTPELRKAEREAEEQEKKEIEDEKPSWLEGVE